MNAEADVQYISDINGINTGVIVPIDLWREIASERETAYLLSTENMKRRLLDAKGRTGGYTIKEVCDRIGI